MPAEYDLKSPDAARHLLAEQMDRLVEKVIREAKFTKPSYWVTKRGRFVLFVFFLTACALAGAWYQWWLVHGDYPNTVSSSSAILPNSASLTTVLITVVAAFFAYYQWTDARREASLDKFYDRLKLINERYYEWKEARELVKHFWPISDPASEESDFRRAMYVFLELDNLEYMIMRYQFGYVSSRLLQRAIRTFLSRCRSEDFGKLAVKLVTGSGYMQKTAEVTKLLVDFGKSI